MTQLFPVLGNLHAHLGKGRRHQTKGGRLVDAEGLADLFVGLAVDPKSKGLGLPLYLLDADRGICTHHGDAFQWGAGLQTGGPKEVISRYFPRIVAYVCAFVELLG